MRKPHPKKKKSIFEAIFVPLILVLFLQGIAFYVFAVYGGIEQSMNQNAADVLSERLINRKNEIETQFNKDWTDMAHFEEIFNDLYAQYTQDYGPMPFVDHPDLQIQYLSDTTDTLINMLRSNSVNGVFLILNDTAEKEAFPSGQTDQKYGVSIRDLDQTSAFKRTEDLLIARSPSALIEQLHCSLDSWWDARYTFASEEEGRYYYYPLNAAWDNPGAKSDDLAYFCSTHSYVSSDHPVVSYSIPLLSEDGFPYGVLGVELTTKYLASLLPSWELSGSDTACYILAMRNMGESNATPIIASGALYNRCFTSNEAIPCSDVAETGGFNLLGRGDTRLYGESSQIQIYNNNNPFESDQLTLLALIETNELFSYSNSVKIVLLWITLGTLILGVCSIFFVSRRFARPITSLSERARSMTPQANTRLGHLGIAEIDQLVDSIESLNQNVSKEIARTEFFSRMSHDMRTPMNAIISFSSEELLEGITEAQKDDYLQKIHASGTYLLGLINEVLDMTKIESNKVDLSFTPQSTAKLWDTIVPVINELALKKDIDFQYHYPTESPLFLLVDQQHLNQIVLNLLSNAVKFTLPGGRVTLDVDFSQASDVADEIICHIRVEDTGIGMSKEFLNKLYTPFEQENSALDGTGLGLSITKKLVDLMHGSIRCTSQKAIGTTFDVFLPMQKCAPTSDAFLACASSDTTMENISSILAGKHILLCEDHPLNAQIASRLLAKKGILVDTAVNGQEGVEKFSASPVFGYDAVLMDIRMPLMDGLAAATAIREMSRSDAQSVPIVAMTANAFDDDVRKSVAAGMNAHLSKPIVPDKLYRTLAELLSIQES